MAAERDLELLDDYLANRLNANDRSAFEQKLKTDPDLKSEYQLQQEFISGIKKARVAGLKIMLNSIPVPAGSSAGTSIVAKIALWAAVTGGIGTSAYFYMTHEAAAPKPQSAVEQPTETQIKPEQANTPAQQDEKPPVVSQTPAASERQPATLPKATQKKPSSEVQTSRKLDVFDPTDETTENYTSAVDSQTLIAKPADHTSIAVTIDREHRKYNFHYQFSDGKLTLYGPFEANLYEIMEFFNDDKRTVFLFYNNQYFLLNEETSDLKPLKAIKDPVLLKKLKEYRN